MKFEDLTLQPEDYGLTTPRDKDQIPQHLAARVIAANPDRWPESRSPSDPRLLQILQTYREGPPADLVAAHEQALQDKKRAEEDHPSFVEHLRQEEQRLQAEVDSLSKAVEDTRSEYYSVFTERSKRLTETETAAKNKYDEWRASEALLKTYEQDRKEASAEELKAKKNGDARTFNDCRDHINEFLVPEIKATQENMVARREAHRQLQDERKTLGAEYHQRLSDITAKRRSLEPQLASVQRQLRSTQSQLRKETSGSPESLRDVRRQERDARYALEAAWLSQYDRIRAERNVHKYPPRLGDYDYQPTDEDWAEVKRMALWLAMSQMIDMAHLTGLSDHPLQISELSTQRPGLESALLDPRSDVIEAVRSQLQAHYTAVWDTTDPDPADLQSEVRLPETETVNG